MDIRLHLVLGRSHNVPWPQWRGQGGVSWQKYEGNEEVETGYPSPQIEQPKNDLWRSIEPTACRSHCSNAQARALASGPSGGSIVASGASGRQGGGSVGDKGEAMGDGPLPTPFRDRCNLSLTHPSLEACSPWHPYPSSHPHPFWSPENQHIFSHPKMPHDPHLRLARCCWVTLWALPSASTRSPHCLSFLPLTPPVPAHPSLTLKTLLLSFSFCLSRRERLSPGCFYGFSVGLIFFFFAM